MMLSLSFKLEGEAAVRAFLIFMFPKFQDEIALENIASCDDVIRILTYTTKLPPGSKTRKQLTNEGFVTFLKARDIDLLDVKKTGLTGTRQLTTITHHDNIDRPLIFATSIRLHTSTFDPVGDYDFFVDIRAKEVSINAKTISKITHLRDLNIPVGFNHTRTSHKISESFNNEELILLALTIMPVYEIDFITEDVIGLARQLCFDRELLTKEDIDFLDAERQFIVSGAQYEHSTLWQ